MRTKFKAWAEPYLNEHKEISLSEEKLSSLKDFYLEIGSGKGDFLVNMAKKFPDIFLLGIEKNVTCAGFTAKKLVENNIENAKLIFSDVALITPHLSDKSVTAVFLNFSDPWPKKRHSKRRLTSETFLDEYRRILKDDGQIILKTDNHDLFEYSIEMFGLNGFKVVSTDEDYDGSDNFDYATEFETRFRNMNMPIYRMVVVKND